MSNKKSSTVAQFLYILILHGDIPDIIQCANAMEFKRVVILFLAQYSIKIFKGQPQKPLTQEFVEKANGAIKDKLSEKMKATRNLKWSEHLIRIALAMNNQRYFNLPYNMTPPEVFF